MHRGLADLPPRPTRYRALAGLLAQAVRDGLYPPGTQLPSVRQLCAEHGASLATVTHALHELEDAGLVEARPRCGHFVHAGLVPRARPPAAAAIELAGRRKRLVDLASTHPDCISLSHLALPSALLPLAALQRHAVQAMASDHHLLSIGTVYGSPALREQLARRAARMGCSFDPEDLVVTHGETESLELCLRLLTQPGDTVVVPSRVPPRTLELINSLGLQPLAIPSPSDTGLSVTALDFALQHHRVAVCIAEPSFDSACGSALDTAARQQLAALLARHRLPMIECDLMGELHRGSQRPPAVKAYDGDDRVLYCGSLICNASPGLSLGYIASHRHRLQLRAARSVHGDLLSPLIDQTLTRFLASSGHDTHLRRLRERLAAQVTAWEQAVRQHFPPGTQVHSGQGGYVLWLELPGGLDAVQLLQRARPLGYTFVPGAVFASGPPLDHALRLSAGHALDETRLRGLRLVGRLAGEMLAEQGA